MSSPASSSTSTEQSTLEQRRVHFAQVDQVHMIPEEELDSDSWYGADEMKSAFRADVIAFLKEFKRNQQRTNDSEDEDEEEEDKEPICSRGLEMYYPGQIALRKRVRAIFSENVLRKYQDLKEVFEDPDEAGEHLQQFATALGETAQKKAHALALQDAIEARIVYAEGLEESSTGSKDSANLEFVPLLKHESKTELSNCKALAA